MEARKRRTKVVIFALGLMVGTALGIVVIGFLAVRAYDHGYDEALDRRRAWRGELVARRAAAARAYSASLKKAS